MRHDPDDALEWLETDGLGGFAMGTASGVRTRRYHALLVAATEPPIGRRVLVEDLEVVALTMAGRFPLTSRRYPAPEGELLHPGGLPRAFQPEPWPRWEIALPDGTVLVHELVVRHGSPVVALRWLRVAGHGPLALEVRPFLGGRGFHALPEAPEPRFPIHVEANELGWELPGDTPDVHLRPFAPAWRWADDPIVHRRALLTDERARGLDHLQDLASPGVLTLDAGDGEEVGLTLAADRRETPETLPAFFPLSESERERRLQLAPRATGGATARLYRAADAYLVRRGAGRTVIAGYPWFGDWGRDTFIALRGLALATGRLDVAAEVVRTWAGHVEGGMLPNRFPDDGEDQGEAEYNSVDAALWYAVVAGETLDALAGAGARDPELEGAVAR
ncbi:MAG: glycogen debranching enzyme N-terminal domain-containing protein, partial [Myxococcota bacterium]